VKPVPSTLIGSDAFVRDTWPAGVGAPRLFGVLASAACIVVALPPCTPVIAKPPPALAQPADPRAAGARPARVLSAIEARAVISEARDAVRSRHSYAAIRSFDVGGAFANARARAGEGEITVAELAAIIDETIAPIGDGHAAARAEGWPDREAPELAAILSVVEPRAGGRVAVLRGDRGGLLSAEHPYLVAIDGVELERWIGVVSAFIPHGSAQMIRHTAVRRLSAPTPWRERAGAHAVREGVCALTLANERGGQMVALVPLRKASRAPDAIRHKTGMLPGGTGYVRLADMDGGEAFLQRLAASFDLMRSARGLVIDVRGNGGGSRAALGVVARAVMAPDAEPIVFNAARPLRLPEDTDESIAERMASRFLFRTDHAGWSARERAAVDRVMSEFKPEVAVPDDRFGPWHVAVLSGSGLGGMISPPPGPRNVPRHGAFPGPVVALMDEECFSATDVFLGAMKEMTGVTLVGSASGGGSGLTTTTPIAGGLIRVRLSSMVSFRPDGLLFDGRGVEPDVTVERTALDGTPGVDSALDAALRILSASVPPDAGSR